MSYLLSPAPSVNGNGEATLLAGQAKTTDSNTDPKMLCFDLTKDPETLKPGSKQWKLTSHEIREALETHGYFLVKYDAISGDDKERLFDAMRSLFDLPPETKRRNEMFKYTMSVYEGQAPNLPLYQSLGIVNAMEKQKAEAFTKLMWPQGNDKFCNALNSMSSKTSELTRLLIDMIFDGYGLGKHKETFMDTCDSLFHMIKYSAPEKQEPTLGLVDHTDINYLTVLGQNEVDGLTIKNKEGESIEVDLGQNHFVVLVGQSLRAWSNGRLHPPFHQVRVRGVKDRLSYALFLTPKPDHMVEAPPEMVDDEHPRQFRPFAYQDIIKFSEEGGGARCADTLRTLAGI